MLAIGYVLDHAEDQWSKIHAFEALTRIVFLAQSGINVREKAKEILKQESIMITLDNEELLKNIVKTAMTGKGAESEKAKFSRIIVTAIKQIEENGTVNLNNIKIIMMLLWRI